MLSFQNHIDEASALKFYNLLPKKVRHAINRLRNQDKYKAALLMIKHLRKDPDVISRGLTKARIQSIAADHFGLNHREFAKILNRQTRYESVIIESYTFTPTIAKDINQLKYSADEKKDIIALYNKLKGSHKTPLIFDTDKRKIKLHRDLKSKTDLGDIKNDYPNLPTIVYGTGSLKKKSLGLEVFGIKNDTEFLEFCQSVGFFISSSLDTNNFSSELNKLFINGDFKIRKFITDWPKFIKVAEADDILKNDVMLLANGSYFYRQEINVTKPYIIWTGINKYYSALKNKEGLKGDVKKNTADCVLIDGTPTALYKALASKLPIVSDDKTGKLKCDGVEWYQISLKKVKGGAKLGKITKLIKGKYDVDQSNPKLAGIDDLFDSNKIDIEFNQLLTEGLFSDGIAKFKEVSKAALNTFKAAAVKIIKFTKNIFANMKKLLAQQSKIENRYIDSLTKRYLKEDILLEKPTTADRMRAIVKEKSLNQKYIKHIKTTFKKVKVVNNKVIASKIVDNKSLNINKDSIAFLTSNVISFNIINKIIIDVNKNGIEVINDLNRSMVMGDTKLPVVKIYGNISKATYEILSVNSVSQTDPALENKDIKILMLSIKPHKEYWVVNMWIFAEIADDIAKYHKVSFKKHGEADLTFDIEGATTQRLDKITEFQ